ncbi:MAG: hypothetical protein ABWX96_12935 [Propionibacteriaceae bacterium]
MAHRLELSYNWRLPVMYSSIGLVICAGLLTRGRVSGWWVVLLILVAMWGIFISLVWLRTQASLMVDGTVLEVRSRRVFHHVDAADVVGVRQFQTPHGPSHKLRVRDHGQPGGGTQTVTVPTALLRGGHSTLFTWILSEAPQAELDKGSRRTVEELQRRGLLP